MASPRRTAEKCHNLHAGISVRNRDHGRTSSGMQIQRPLDLAELDAKASPLDHPIPAPHVSETLASHPADDVAGVVPADAVANVKRPGVFLRTIPVAGRNRRAADVQQAFFARRRLRVPRCRARAYRSEYRGILWGKARSGRRDGGGNPSVSTEFVSVGPYML